MFGEEDGVILAVVDVNFDLEVVDDVVVLTVVDVKVDDIFVVKF